LQGHPDRVLSDPNSIVLSEETVKKYFGKEDPVGKSMTLNNDKVYMVTGVFSDPPKNSSLDFDILISFEYMENTPWYSEHWGSNSISTYVLLNDKADTSQVNRKLTAIVDAHNEHNNIEFMVAPLKRMHLYSYFGFDRSQMGIKAVMIFIAVGLFVLIIASINFMNLATAKSSTRAKEIAMRKINGAQKKAMGATRRSILALFSREFIILLLVSAFISWPLAYYFLNNWLQDFDYRISLSFWIFLGAATLSLLVAIFSISYHAFRAAGRNPADTLRYE
jgi:ABC-type antimicrobial peptide transport system permease subunit